MRTGGFAGLIAHPAFEQLFSGNPSENFETLVPALDEREDAPDEMYLVETETDTWCVYLLIKAAWPDQDFSASTNRFLTCAVMRTNP